MIALTAQVNAYEPKNLDHAKNSVNALLKACKEYRLIKKNKLNDPGTPVFVEYAVQNLDITALEFICDFKDGKYREARSPFAVVADNACEHYVETGKTDDSYNYKFCQEYYGWKK